MMIVAIFEDQFSLQQLSSSGDAVLRSQGKSDVDLDFFFFVYIYLRVRLDGLQGGKTVACFSFDIIFALKTATQEKKNLKGYNLLRGARYKILYFSKNRPKAQAFLS